MACCLVRQCIYIEMAWLFALPCHHVRHGVDYLFNTLRPRQSGRHFPDDIFKCIFLNESIWISIGISLKSVSKGPFNNIPALVQIMSWRRPGNKPLSEPMLDSLPTHICVTRPQCVKINRSWSNYQLNFSYRHHLIVNSSRPSDAYICQ